MSRTADPARPGAAEAARPVPPSSWWAPVVTGLVTFGVFLPSLGNGFVDFDDGGNFVHNPHYRGLGPDQLRWMFTTFGAGHYQPLSWLTLGLDYVIWGMDPLGYHLTNIVLHACAAAVFAGIAAWFFTEVRKAPGRGGPWFGALIALAWSLHPLRVEGVTWITERREVVCGLLTLLAVASHLRGRPRWQIAVLTLLAMLAKATAVTIPVMLVLVDVWRGGSTSLAGLVRDAGRAILRHVHLVVLAAIGSFVAILAQRDAQAMVSYETLSFARRLVLLFVASAFGSLKTLWPSGLAPLHQGTIGATWEFHPHVWWEALVGLVLVAAALALGWLRRRRGLGWLCLAAAYLVMIAPAGGLGQSGPQTAAERYTYQPGWVLALAAGLAVASLPRWPARWWTDWRAAAPAALVLGALGFMSVRQQGVWHDSGTLWRRQLEVYPKSPLGNHHLGYWYLYDQPPDFAKAETHLRTSVAVAPAYAAPRLTLAGLLFSTARGDEALETLGPVLAQDPDHPTALFLTAKILWEAGRRDESIAAFARLAAADPRNAESWRQLAKAQAAGGHARDAVATYERAIASAPHPAVLSDFAWLLATHPDVAVRDGARALALADKAATGGPPDFRTVLVLAAACAETGDFERAIREVAAAIPKLPPEKEPALRGLLEDLGKRVPVRTEPRFP